MVNLYGPVVFFIEAVVFVASNFVRGYIVTIGDMGHLCVCEYTVQLPMYLLFNLFAVNTTTTTTCDRVTHDACFSFYFYIEKYEYGSSQMISWPPTF